MHTLELVEDFFLDLFLKKMLSQLESHRAFNCQPEMLKLANNSNKSSQKTFTTADLISLFLMPNKYLFVVADVVLKGLFIMWLFHSVFEWH